jgi:hypothetical protein
MADDYASTTTAKRLKDPQVPDVSLADVRQRTTKLRDVSITKGPAGEDRADTSTAVVRNVAGPASDAVRKKAIAKRLAEKENPTPMPPSQAAKPDIAGPIGGPTIMGAYRNLKQNPGRIDRDTERQVNGT